MKILAMILAASGIALAACSSEDEPTTETNEDAESAAEVMTETDETDAEEAESTEEGEGVNVDKGLFNVEVTLPPSFFEGEDPERVAAVAADTVEEAIVNEDGSITYKMSRSQHKEMLEELTDSIEAAKNQITESGDYPSIQSIETTDNYDRFTINVDREAFENSFDSFATLTLGFVGSYYQLLDGKDADNYEVIVETKDAETGEVFGTATYPDALDEMDGE